jgi:hypothetical protein
MVDIVYTAKRELVNALDDVVSITQSLQSYDRSTEVKKTESVSMGGQRQSTLHYYTNNFSIKTMPIAVADRPEFDEFIYSTINNETFTIVDVDDASTRVVQRVGEHSRSRVTTGTVDYFTYSFNVREVV